MDNIPTKLKKDIFISYTSKDVCISDNILKKSQEIFKNCGNIYIDRFHPHTKIHPQLTIAKKLITANLLVIIESESTYKSPWVLFEIALAKLTLTPIMKIPVSRITNQKKYNTAPYSNT